MCISFPYSSHKGKQNCRCLPEFIDSETAASSNVCVSLIGRVPVTRPEYELSHLWVEVFNF